MRMLVLGAGLQGSACAFDLLNEPAVSEVTIADVHVGSLPPFLQQRADARLVPIALDVRDEAAVRAAFSRCDAVLSAIPYYFNASLARLAVECGVHFADLGGNTQIVQEQKQLHDAARVKGISVIPDTGLAPGMVNVIAQHGIDQFDTVEAVKLFVGGLEGMVDYYTTPSLVVRDGAPTTVEALSEVETVPFEAPVGTLEAFHTAGVLSTMVYRYAGRIPRMEYKTLRYPGHASIMRAIRDLGLLDTAPVDLGGQMVSPRALFVEVAGGRLRRGKPDLVALRVEVTGMAEGRSQSRRWEVVDRYDAVHGISAMMRTTGYTLSITGQLQARGLLQPGVHTPDECIPPKEYIEALGARGILVRAS